MSFFFILSVFFFTLLSEINLYSEDKHLSTELPFQIKWPIHHKKAYKISSTFAESRYDHFHNGLDIPVNSMKVYPVSAGNVLWVKKSKRRLNEPPFGGGNTVVLRHDNIWSGYMHLKNIDSQLIFNKVLSVNDNIGLSGKTGHSGGAHLHFFIFNFKYFCFYNPLLLIDKKNIKDTKPPKLRNYKVTSSKKNKNDFAQNIISNNILLARIEDQGGASEKWGIYYLKVYDKEDTLLREITFDYIQFINHHWVSSNKLTFRQVYYRNYYILHNNSEEKIKLEAGGLYGPPLIVKWGQ